MNDDQAKQGPNSNERDVLMPSFGSSRTEILLDRVGRKIVETRKLRGISQTQLARAASVPTSVIFSAENGLHNTSLVTLAKTLERPR